MRRWLLAFGVYVAITVALTYPLLLRFTSAIAHDAGDPVLNTWILWWNTHAVPFGNNWWNAPMFYPASSALALSEVLLGLWPITGFIELFTGSPLVAYNAAFVLSYPLCGIAAYLFAFELTGRRDASLLAGLAFAFAPYRIEQLAHLQMLSYYWAPIALLALHRYLRLRTRASLGLFAAAWAMQSLSNGYAMFHLSVLIVLWLIWFVRSPREAAPIVAVWAVGSLPLLPILLKYREVHGFLHLTRDINEIKRFGLDLSGFLAASPENALWGSRLWPAGPETAAFPGATLLVLALIWAVVEWKDRRTPPLPRTRDAQVFTLLSAVAALIAFSTITFGPWKLGPLSVSDFHKPFSIAVAFRVLASLRSPWARRAWHERSVTAFYVLAMVAAYLIALGPEPRLLGRPMLYEPPYAWLMRLPGFETMRVPARFVMLAVLCQSALVGLGLARLLSSAKRAAAVAVLVGCGLLADGWVWLRAEAAPAPGPQPDQAAAAVVELPAGGIGDFGALYRGMTHGRPIVNGFSGYYPPFYLPFTFAIRDGQYSALYEVANGHPLAVAVNRDAPGAGVIEAGLTTMAGVARGPASDRWASFTVVGRAPAIATLGEPIDGGTIQANRFPQDVARMTDGNVETSWASGPSQIGDEEITIDLGSPRDVGSIVFEMGAFAFGYPRALEVDSSQDGATWDPIWGGQPVVLTVRAAVARPDVVPVTIDLGKVTTRYLRFRQTGAEPGIPWWIPELSIRGPATGAR